MEKLKTEELEKDLRKLENMFPKSMIKKSTDEGKRMFLLALSGQWIEIARNEPDIGKKSQDLEKARECLEKAK